MIFVNRLYCPKCKGDLLIDHDKDIFMCEDCKTKYKIPHTMFTDCKKLEEVEE